MRVYHVLLLLACFVFALLRCFIVTKHNVINANESRECDDPLLIQCTCKNACLYKPSFISHNLWHIPFPQPKYGYTLTHTHTRTHTPARFGTRSCGPSALLMRSWSLNPKKQQVGLKLALLSGLFARNNCSIERCCSLTPKNKYGPTNVGFPACCSQLEPSCQVCLYPLGFDCASCSAPPSQGLPSRWSSSQENAWGARAIWGVSCSRLGCCCCCCCCCCVWGEGEGEGLTARCTKGQIRETAAWKFLYTWSWIFSVLLLSVTSTFAANWWELGGLVLLRPPPM